MVRVVLLGSLAVVALTLLWSTFRVIGRACRRGPYFGKVQKDPLHEGLHVINPLLSVTTMSTQVQKRQARYDAASKDLQAVHVEMVLNYRLLPDRAPEVLSTDRDRLCQHHCRSRRAGSVEGQYGPP